MLGVSEKTIKRDIFYLQVVELGLLIEGAFGCILFIASALECFKVVFGRLQPHYQEKCADSQCSDNISDVIWIHPDFICFYFEHKQGAVYRFF